MAASLQDVIDQMTEAGITGLSAEDLVADGRYHRFRPDEERKKKKSGWYVLFEHVTAKSGKLVFNGAFGLGADTYKVAISDGGLSVEDRAEWARQRKENEKAAAEQRKKEALSAANKALRLWNLAKEEGASAYLDRKAVRAFGVRFLNGSVVVPVRTAAGALVGCQYIDGEGNKRFNTGMSKAGNFHLIGDPAKCDRLLFAEGYATAAALFMATGWPVVVCFDADNVEKVAGVLRPLYPKLQFIFCGDDDRHLRRRLRERLAKLGVPGDVEPEGVEHVFHINEELLAVRAEWQRGDGAQRILFSVRRGSASAREWVLENAGRRAAVAGARKFSGVAVFPSFSAEAAAGTDFNDLLLAEGQGVVRSQVLAALSAATEGASTPKAGRARQEAAVSGGQMDACLREWALIYPTDTMWDGFRRRIVKMPVAKLMYGAPIVEQWLGHPGRRTVIDSDVVFDPALEHGDHQINLFDGWPVAADAGKPCNLLTQHLFDVCGEDEKLFEWVAKWLAFPLQHPGAKMRTALIVHGPEGTGKSIFFDVMREIYGEYGRTVTQLQLQSEYTDWLSKMMFCVAEEVVTRQDLTHHKGLLKNLITNPVVNINEKYMPLRTESNRANFTFLSNEINPAKLDQGDRRYTVIWYEPNRGYSEDYFKALGAEIRNGGAAGLYAWLMSLDLEGFNEHTRPYENRARRELIDINMPARDRFYIEWKEGLICDVPYGPARVEDLYLIFQRWCRLRGDRYVDNSTTLGTMLGRHMFKGVKQGEIWTWDKIEEGAGYRKVRARKKWRGTVVVPRDWRPPATNADDRDPLFKAVRELQEGAELFLNDSRMQLAA